MDKIIEFIQKEIESGLLKGLNYNRLVLNKDNFSKTNIRTVNHLGISCDIIEGNDDKNYLIDMSKVEWKRGKTSMKIVEAVFKSSEVLKEVAFIY